jgi:hypothetical protein
MTDPEKEFFNCYVCEILIRDDFLIECIRCGQHVCRDCRELCPALDKISEGLRTLSKLEVKTRRVTIGEMGILEPDNDPTPRADKSLDDYKSQLTAKKKRRRPSSDFVD